MNIDKNIKKSIRKVFGNTLAQVGELNEDIVVLDADLSCSTQTKIFADKFPHRFFNCGIAEQNMIATAAGLATQGKVPFAATFAMFATGRTYDQIRNGVCYSDLNVKIIGTHGGVTVGEDGATHQALEDVSLMRGLPNMTVIVPSDCNECEQVLEYAAKHQGPVYIRISRNSLPDIYSSDYKFDINKAVVLKNGSDVTIVSNGDIMAEVCKAAEILQTAGIDAEVISLPVVKPFDSDTIIKSAKKTNFVVSVENHSINGGIGSAVCETLSENYPVKVLRIGINDEFGQSGDVKDLLKHYGLDAQSLANRIEKTYDSIKIGN